MSICKTTCPYCGVGCGVIAERDEADVIRVSGDDSHPANYGRLCVKGSTLAETMVPEGRLLEPQLGSEVIGWSSAVDLIATKLTQVRDEYGPDAIAFYLSGQLLTEDYYVANKLMKGFIGSANVDTNSRLCMASAVAGYKRAFGADYVPCSYADLETCDLLIMVGSNAAWTHPVLYQRISESKKHNPNKRVVVVDPRRTASCDIADLHLQISPGSDGFLFNGLLHHLSESEHLNKSYMQANTMGFADAVATAAAYDFGEVCRKTGLQPVQLSTFYELFSATEKTITFYSQGVNQSATGTDKCNAIINCHLATGRIGKPGMGPFSITGQPNAMGGREVGGLANQLAAHMDFNPRDIDIVQRFWRAPNMAQAAGLKAVDLFEAAADGAIRFLWIMATNPAVSLPDTGMVRRALERCDFVVVSDCIAGTDTAKYADLLLPAAGWGEKEGTVTNSERCISRQRALVPCAGDARPDWEIVTDVAHRLGFSDAFDYSHPRDIFVEHARLSGFENDGSRDFDISALGDLTAVEYDSLTPVYWPLPKEARPQDPIAMGSFFTASGRANFISISPTVPEASEEAELVLNTGRLRDQWHTMTRTGLVPKLLRHRQFFSLSLSPKDAGSRDLRDGDLVEISNAQGRVAGLVRIEDELPPGQMFSPIHWNDDFASSACISELIASNTDPISGQPQSKYARVRANRLPVSCWGMALSRDKEVRAEFIFWSRIPVFNGYLTLFALREDIAPEQFFTEKVQSISNEVSVCEYRDAASLDFRAVVLDGKQASSAIFLHADQHQLPTSDWVATLFGSESGLDASALLAGRQQGKVDPGRLICTCEEVGERQITTAISEGVATVEALGAKLRCGTQCGSCVPELKCLLQLAKKDRVA
ncbi:MAG: nitrate reductase [Pseudomonadota bacterium]